MFMASPKKTRPTQTSFAAWDGLVSAGLLSVRAPPVTFLDELGWISSDLIGTSADLVIPPVELDLSKVPYKKMRSKGPLATPIDPSEALSGLPSHPAQTPNPPNDVNTNTAKVLQQPLPTPPRHDSPPEAHKPVEFTLSMTDKEMGFAIPDSWRSGGKHFDAARRAETTPTAARFRLTDGSEDNWFLWFEIWADFVRANGNKRPSYRSSRKRRGGDSEDAPTELARDITALTDAHSTEAEEALLLTAIPREGPGFLYGGRLHNWIMSQKRNNRLTSLGSGEVGETRKKALVDFLAEIHTTEAAKDAGEAAKETKLLETNQAQSIAATGLPNPPSPSPGASRIFDTKSGDLDQAEAALSIPERPASVVT